MKKRKKIYSKETLNYVDSIMNTLVKQQNKLRTDKEKQQFEFGLKTLIIGPAMAYTNYQIRCMLKGESINKRKVLRLKHKLEAAILVQELLRELSLLVPLSKHKK